MVHVALCSLIHGNTIGSHSPTRGRETVFRKCKTRPYASYKNARICLADGTVSSAPHADLYSFVFNVSSSSSKQLAQPAGQSIPPSKLAAIQAQAATSSEKGDTGSHKEGSSGSSPRSEGTWSPFHIIFSILIWIYVMVHRFSITTRRPYAKWRTARRFYRST